jgi:type IV pilus assembly protein PilE
MKHSIPVRIASPKASSLTVARGFTLIELLVVICITAILASIAVPAYSSYITQSRAKGASSDLVALALVYEADFQTALQYPLYSANTTVPGLPSNRTGTQVSDFGSWAAAEASYYTYSLVSSTATAYTLKAAANSPNTCVLTLTSTGTRTATGNCGFTSW